MTTSGSVDKLHVRQDGPSTMLCNERGWWEVARARFIRERIAELTTPGATIADVGCGRGRLLTEPALAGRIVVNVDSFVWNEWKGRPGVFFVCASADALPFRDGSFDLVGSFDVLEHLPDDEAALREQRRIVSDDGVVVTAVPADSRLWSGHDVAAGHLRRYDVSLLGVRTEVAGLGLERSTYFFSYLWAPAWLTRSRAGRAEPGNRNGPLGAVVRGIVGTVARAERFVLRHRRVPFGTSLWAELRPRHSTAQAAR